MSDPKTTTESPPPTPTPAPTSSETKPKASAPAPALTSAFASTFASVPSVLPPVLEQEKEEKEEKEKEKEKEEKEDKGETETESKGKEEASSDSLEAAVGRMKASDESKEDDDPLPIMRGAHLFDVELDVQQSMDGSPLKPVIGFEEMNLPPKLLEGVYNAGFVKPSRVQSVAIPMILANPPQNLIGQSQSGTGKTAAFSLGMMSRIDPAIKAPQALCLAPTRELVRQIHSVATTLGQFYDISIRRLVKDERFPKGFRITDQLVIGTAGRMMDLIKRRMLPANNVKILVLDEADVMLDIQGMGDQSVRVRNLIPKQCQILLFSATFKLAVRKFAVKMVPNPNIIQLKREELSLDAIKQFYIDCGSEEKKLEVLFDLYGFMTIGQSIIFVHTRRTAASLAAAMQKNGHAVSLLHGGDMEGSERDRVIDDFREGKSKVLITTNVLARGIDILQVSLVVNYDLPLDVNNKPDPETYLHRIGRSGRFGRKGTAINFVHDDSSRKNVAFFKEFFKRDIVEIPIDDIENLEDIIKQ